MNKHTALVALTALPLIAALGCNELANNVLGGDSAGEAAEAVGSLDLTNQEAALMALGVELLDPAMSTEDIATAIAADGPDRLTPAGCARAEAVGSVVTWTFEGCAGPFGLEGLSGVAALTYSLPSANEVAINLTATDLEAQGATLTINTSGTARVEDDGTRRIALTTSGGGVLPDGTVIARAGSYTADLEGGCVTLNGTWNTTIEASIWSTAVSGYKRCDGGCPEDGTLIYTALEDEGGAAGELGGSAVTLQFDGSDQASFASSSGNVGVAELACTP